MDILRSAPEWSTLSPDLKATIKRALAVEAERARRIRNEDLVLKNEDLVLCLEHPEDLFSQVHIDSTLSELRSRVDIAVVKLLYLRLAYGSKLPYFEGSPKFALRGLNFLEPNVENIIVGECQSGKSAEAAWIAWNSFFTLGKFPVIFIRNNGGRIQGYEDMKNAVDKLNRRIQQILEDPTSQEVLAQQGVKKTQLQHWIASKRFNIVVETEEAAFDGFFKGYGKVLVVLQNPTHLGKVMNPFLKSRAQWYAATVSSQQSEHKWEVTFQSDGQKATLKVSDLRAPNNTPLSESDCIPGCKVRARMPEEQRWHEGVIPIMDRLYGKKGASNNQKTRIVFIMDEADLFVGNAKRKGNKSSTMMFHDKIRGDAASGNRGAREYVYGSVYITATPQALFVCDWKASQKAPQEDDEDLATESGSLETESDSGAEGADKGSEGSDDEAASGADNSSGTSNASAKGDRSGGNGSGQVALSPRVMDDTRPANEGDAGPADDESRFLKPHLVFTDRAVKQPF